MLPHRRAVGRARLRVPAAAAAVGMAAALGVVAAPPAMAAGTVVATPTASLDPDGQSITVTGTGFAEDQGIYVSVCKDNGPGEQPTPCLGGMDTTGTSGSAAWISSNPPTYAEGLTTPYGPGGSFEITLFVVAADPRAQVDCMVDACSVVTRSDHTASADRSQDTRTSVTFVASDGVPAATEPTAPHPSTAQPTSAARPTPIPADLPTETTDAPDQTTSTTDDASTAADSATGADDSSGVPAGIWVAAAAVAVVLAAGLVLIGRRTRRSTAQ